MENTEYWVEICQQGKTLGAGFVLTRHYVLTAYHCLRGLDPEDENLELSFAGGEVTEGRIYEYASGADLALIDILKPRDKKLVLPSADRARQGDAWFAPYRPRNDEPHLAGDVVSGAVAYRCEAGHEIEALQLNCSQATGTYSGYSGGPVERREGKREPSLIGVLLEQYPDRQDGDRASGVLFAATIAEALRRFDCLDMGHLMKVLTAGDGLGCERPSTREFGKVESPGSAPSPYRHSPRDSPGSHIAEARSIIDNLHELGKSNVINPIVVSLLKWRAARRMVDGK